ncbi:multidrug ABC transporter ATP-binding protein [Serratia sp. S1B]|nr:multidrug ABC transporter ATP-binding protein [Serratia sp. S1B]
MLEQQATATVENAVVMQAVTHRYGQVQALDAVSLTIPKGVTVGLIGPDGVGKSTLLSLIAGIKVIQTGSVHVLGCDLSNKKQQRALSHKVAFMPQGLGHNLYPTLSVYENVDFHARLFGLPRQARHAHIQRLLEATGLAQFAERAAGKLSGGMKQKLSLCCALVHQPELLILDEPTTGVDPLSRRQFWSLVDSLRSENQGMTVLVSTAYIDEAERFEYLLAMDDGKLLASAPTETVLQQTQSQTLEQAYIKLLPDDKKTDEHGLQLTPFIKDENSPPAIEAVNLTKSFGDFTAVDHVNFTIERGEIFGFLGSNGCGKSTTMKMLTGLLEATEGSAKLLGTQIETSDMQTRLRVGYMSQAFSLYEELTVRQNLVLHAQLYRMPEAKIAARVDAALQEFDLESIASIKPSDISLGMRQRLQLAAACLHHPEVLILDEPTSGVDPAARDMFWRHLLRLSRDDRITIFVSTHFMNEAARCDRISFMHRGQVLAVGSPEQLCQQQQTTDLEEAFIAYLQEASQQEQATPIVAEEPVETSHEFTDLSHLAAFNSAQAQGVLYWLATVWTFAVREGKELFRDKIRLFFALIGPVILMMAAAYGVSFDVKKIKFAVLDRDQTIESRELIQNFSASSYFKLTEYLDSSDQIDYSLKSSQARLVIDIPPHFGQQLMRGEKPEVGFYIDGSLPFIAENIKGFVLGILTSYLNDKLQEKGYSLNTADSVQLQPRYVYNQDFKSIYAMAPGMIMLATMLIPVMMTALGVVREREIGSITNLYTSPASVRQFLIGKQLPYIAVAMCSYLILVWLAVVVLRVPVRGNFFAMALGGFALICAATSFGLLISSFVKSQVAAIFGSAILSMIPALNFSGLFYPLSTLTGVGYWIGWCFPTSWFQLISLGGFTKGLSFQSFIGYYLILFGFGVVYVFLAGLVLKKQEV